MRVPTVGRLVFIIVPAVCALAAAACGGVGPVSSPESSPLRVEVSPMFITVENRSGLALRDVRVQIVPVGRVTDFSIVLARLENGEKRDLPLGSFRGRDGTPFNQRVVRPKTVKVSGTDINNKTTEVEVPWK